MSNPTTRREFLGSAAAATAAGWAGAQLYATGASAAPGPNETINMALIGCGGEGRAVMAGHMLCPDARIVAVYDLNSTLGDLFDRQRNASGGRVGVHPARGCDLRPQGRHGSDPRRAPT